MYQDLYNRPKKVIKKDVCMQIYDASRPLYLETQVSGVSHGVETFHHYCFARGVCLITDHKSLVAIISKDVAMLFQ